jgi:hypothetical protein
VGAELWWAFPRHRAARPGELDVVAAKLIIFEGSGKVAIAGRSLGEGRRDEQEQAQQHGQHVNELVWIIQSGFYSKARLFMTSKEKNLKYRTKIS